MALGRGKDTRPFQLAVQEETNPPKREVSSGQEALLTPSAGVLSCPPPNSPKQSPHPRQREISKSSEAPASINPLSTHFKPAPLPQAASPDSSHTHTRGALQSRPTQTHPSATKTKTEASNTRWVLLPPTGSSPLSPRAGGRGPRSASLRPGASPQAGRGRALTHPPGGRSRPGANPESRRGSATGRGGAGAGKASCSYRDARPGARPPQPTRPIGPRAQPRPAGAPSKPRPHRAPGAGAAPSHSTCAREAALGRP